MSKSNKNNNENKGSKIAKDVQSRKENNEKSIHSEINLEENKSKDTKKIKEGRRNSEESSSDESNKESKFKIKDPALGSNNCVISGKYTYNGSPFLCNDPHLFNTIPAVWYLVNLKIKKDDYHFIGASIIGIPSIFVGSNNHLNFGLTVAHSDTADVLRVLKSKKGENKYILDGQEHNMVVNQEIFYVNKAKTESLTRQIYRSPLGIVLNGYSTQVMKAVEIKNAVNLLEEDKYFYIMRPNYIYNNLDLGAVLVYHLSKSIAELRNTANRISISINIVFADKQNNIGYQLIGHIPKKTKIGQLSYIQTAHTRTEFYVEFIPFEDLPFILNPAKGYIVSSNNPIINKYKYAIQGSFCMDSRSKAMSKAIQSMIDSKIKITADILNERVLKNIEDMEAINIIQMIRQILQKDKTVILKPDISRYLNRLYSFDGLMIKNSFSALLFNVL